MRPFSQIQPFQKRDVLIQGDSVRQIWGVEDGSASDERRQLRREPPARVVPIQRSEDMLCVRLGEEIDYVRRMLNALGDQLLSDPILIRRHAVGLQSLDIVDQILGHVGNVVRSSEPGLAIEQIEMSDLKARLTRSRAL